MFNTGCHRPCFLLAHTANTGVTRMNSSGQEATIPAFLLWGEKQLLGAVPVVSGDISIYFTIVMGVMFENISLTMVKEKLK